MGAEKGKIVPFTKKSVAKAAKSASNLDINASSSPREPALPEEELRAAVSRIVLRGTFRESKHSSQDRAYRNVSDDDIVHMLEGFWVLEGADWDGKHRNWKYRLTGTDIEGDALTLVIAVNVEFNRIEIITKGLS